MLYQLYGLVVQSDNPISGIPLADRSKVDVRIRHVSSSPIPSPSHWLMHWYLPGGRKWLSAAKMGDYYLLRFNELADFFINDFGQEVVCIPNVAIPRETINHLLLDQVIPLVINLKGSEALHVSAVLTPKGVVAFAGPTGSGKSTLTASFVSMGYPFMSDDCLALLDKGGEIYGMPAYPGLRLWEDTQAYLFGDNGSHESVAHYTDKQRVPIEKKPGAYCVEPHPLRQLYAIAEPSEVKGRTDIMIERLSPRDRFMALIRCAFRLDITDRNMLIRQFHFLELIASTVSVRRLIFPRDFRFLPAVREAILNDLKILN